MRTRLEAVRADITTLAVDAIVDAFCDDALVLCQSAPALGAAPGGAGA